MKIYIGEISESLYYGVYNLIKMIYPHSEFTTDKSQSDICYEFEINNDFVCVFKNNIALKEDVIYDNIPLTLKRIIYKAENAKLPFGVLTGVRPSKTSAEYGNDEKILEDVYYVNKEKAHVAALCAIEEKKLEKLLPKGSISLYINIPFCPSRCSYCSFTMANTKNEQYLDKYFEALIKDIRFTAQLLKDNDISTYSIYIGGGTPTVLNEKQLERLTGLINESFFGFKEFTVEAGRPDTVNDEKMQILFSNNVSRVSINPQTLNDKTLKLIGRKHSEKQFYEAYDCAVRAGFKNINTDLIAGLSGETKEDFIKTFDKIYDISPQSITVHTLCKKRCAVMDYEEITKEEKCVSQMFDYVYDKLDGKYHPYYIYRQKNAIGSFENVGFVKNSDVCAYNIIMMQETGSVISAGAGGTSKIIDYNEKIPVSKLRCEKQVHEYIKNIDEILIKKKEFIVKNKNLI